MAELQRNIFTVHATLVHSQGTYSKVSGFPKEFDSADYADETHPAPIGNPEKALRRAKAAAYAQLSAFFAVDDHMMNNVYITQADGRTILQITEGGFPEPTPAPNPNPEQQQGNEEPVENPETPGEGE